MVGNYAEGLMIAIAVVFPMFLIAAKQYFKRGFFCPEMYVAVFFIYGTTYKVLYIQYAEGMQALKSKLLMGFSSQILLDGMLLLLISLIVFFSAMWLADGLFKSRRRRETSLVLRPMVFHVLVFSLLLVSIIGFVLFIRSLDIAELLANLVAKRFSEEGGSGRFEHQGYLYYRMALLAKIAVIVVAVAYWGTAKRGLIPLYFLVALFMSLSVPIFFSNRFGALLVLVDLMLVYVTLRGGLSKKAWVLSGSIIVILLLSLSAIRYGESDGNGAEGGSLAGRYLLDVYKVSVITNHYQHIDHPNIFGALQGGRDIVSGVADIGDHIANEVFHEPFNNIPPGVIPEVFVKYGWVGTCVMMAMLGVLVSIAGWYAHNSSSLVLRMVFHMFIFRIVFLLSNNDMATLLIKPIIDLLPIYLIASVVFAHSKHRASEM